MQPHSWVIALSLCLLLGQRKKRFRSSVSQIKTIFAETNSLLPLACAPRALGACLLGGAVQFLAEGDSEFLAERRELVDVLLVLLRVLRLLLCWRDEVASVRFRSRSFRSANSFSLRTSSRTERQRTPSAERTRGSREREREREEEEERTQALEHADGGRKVVYPTSGTESLLNDCVCGVRYKEGGVSTSGILAFRPRFSR